MRLLLFTFLFLNFFSTNAQTHPTVLEGFLRDSVTKEELIGASVKVTRNDTLVKGTITNFDGHYRIPLEPGVYEVEFSYTGYKSFFFNKIVILTTQTTRLNISLLATKIKTMRDWHCCNFWPPLLDKSPGNSGATFTSQMLRHAY